MLTIQSEKHSNAFSLFFSNIGQQTTHLLANTIGLIAPSFSDGGMDMCSFYSGPSDETIAAFGESLESCGSVAYADGGESCGSIAYSDGGESCGSIASSGSFSGGGCSFTC